MKFGILFTSHPNAETEPYPHRDVHARVTREIQEADALGYDTAWIAERHFSDEDGILPDPFASADMGAHFLGEPPRRQPAILAHRKDFEM